MVPLLVKTPVKKAHVTQQASKHCSVRLYQTKVTVGYSVPVFTDSNVFESTHTVMPTQTLHDLILSVFTATQQEHHSHHSHHT